MLRSQSRSVISQKRPIVTCSLCTARPIPTRRDIHNSSKNSDSQFAPRQLHPQQRAPSEHIQRILRSAANGAANQPPPPKKWGNLVRRLDQQAPAPTSGAPGAPAPGPRAWGNMGLGGSGGSGYGLPERAGGSRRIPGASSYSGPGSSSGGSVPIFGAQAPPSQAPNIVRPGERPLFGAQQTQRPPNYESPIRRPYEATNSPRPTGYETPVRYPSDSTQNPRPTGYEMPTRRSFEAIHSPRATGYETPARRPFDAPPTSGSSILTGRVAFDSPKFEKPPPGAFERRPFGRSEDSSRGNMSTEGVRKKKPWEVDDASAARVPSSSRFSKIKDEPEIPLFREETTDGRYQKKVAAREKERVKNRREFVDDVGFVDEEKGMSAKELKRLKKAKKKETKKELIPILLPQFISVENLSTRLNVPLKRFEKQLQEMGFEETNGDLILNAENAGLIAQELGYEVIVDRSDELDIKPRPPAEDLSILPQRPPVVTIMGHVDHGKTTLLDWLRKSSIVDSEHGGITQHIGAFSVTMPSGKIITFLDTPGHAAFLSMRERGANVTDIVILVVAADDSVKPQTIEAIKHAKAAEVPIIVAINKCDKDGANIEKVKNDLAVNGVDIEDFGGETQVVCVSGKSGMGMEDLEEATVTLGELLDHRAEPDGQVEGWVLEATTKKRGRVATMLVTRGTLRPGDIIVAGRTWTRIKTLVNEHGEEIQCASPGQPVEIDGWRDQPEAGEVCLQADTEDRAKRAVDYRIEKYQRIQQAIDMEAINKTRRLQREKEERENAIRAAAIEAGEDPEEAVIKANRELERNTQTIIEVPLIIKGDVDGSVEACVEALQGIGNSEVKTRIIRASFGEVSEFDIDHAAASGAYVVSFNLPKDPQMFQYARQRGVNILAHNIIYRLADEVKEKVQDRLPPRIKTNVTGEAEVIAIFPIKVKGRKTKNVAGCKINNGLISKKSKVRVLRGPEGAKEEVYNGTLDSLKNVKLDVTEMKKGQECGMGFDGWTEFLVGDRVQSYETVEEKRYL